MVNFKKVILQLLAVGIACVSAQSETTCSIYKRSDGELIQEKCEDGYYLLNDYYSLLGNKNANANGILVKVNEGKASIIEIPVPGYYKNKGSGYIQCTNGECKIYEVPSTECKGNNDVGKLIYWVEKVDQQLEEEPNEEEPNEEEPNEEEPNEEEPNEEEPNGEEPNGEEPRKITRNKEEEPLEIKLCSKINDKYFGISFKEEEKDETGAKWSGETKKKDLYLIEHVLGKENIFNFDREKKYYVLEVTEEYIMFDPEVEFEDQCALQSTGKVVERKEDFCSSDSSGKYFTCKRGKCTSKKQESYEDDNNNGESNNCEFEIDAATDGEFSCNVKTESTCDENNNGYHLVSTGTGVNEITKLIKYTHDDVSPSCDVEKEPVIGYYRNSYQYNDVIKCDLTTKCSMVDEKDIIDKCEGNSNGIVDYSYAVGLCDRGNVILFKENTNAKIINGASALVFSDENAKYILSVDKYSITGKAKPGYSIVDNLSGEIRCSHTNSGNGEFFVDKAGEIIIDEDGNVFSSESKAGYLVKISSSTSCTVITQPYTNGGYYITDTEYKKHLIYCNGGKCEISKVNGDEPKYYLNSINKSTNPLIKCDGNSGCNDPKLQNIETGYYIDSGSGAGGLIYCTSTSCNSVKSKNRYYYVSGDGELIYSENNKVVIKDNNGITEKIFLNGGSDGKPLIKYDESSKKWKSENGKENTIYNNGNGSNLKKPFILCKSETNCVEIDANISNEYISVGDGKKFIYCIGGDQRGICGSSTGNEWVRKEVADGKAYFVNENLEIKTNNSGKNGKLVYCESKQSMVIECEVNPNLTTSSPYKDFKYYVNAQDNGLIQIKSDGPYLLRKGKVDKGYYINSITGGTPNVIVCKSDGCQKLNSNAFSSHCSGEIIHSDGKFCNNAVLQGTTPTKYIFEGSGIGESGSILFNVNPSEKAITKITLEGKEKYYLVNANDEVLTGKTMGGSLYKCKSSGCVKIIDVGNYSNDDYETAENYPIINCSQDSDNPSSLKCEYKDRENRDTYCFEEGSKKLNFCKEGCLDCMEIEPKIGKYLDGKSGSMVECSESKGCDFEEVRKVENVGFTLGEDVTQPLIRSFIDMGKVVYEYSKKIADGYYVMHGAKSKLFKCRSKSCKTFGSFVEKFIESSQLKKRQESTANVVWLKNGEDGKPILRCVYGLEGMDNGCYPVAIPEVGYYVNENGDDPSGNFLLKCSYDNANGVECNEYKPSGIENGSKYFKSLGAFLDGKELIECTSQRCEAIEVDDFGNYANGYYINGANNQLIYCKNNMCNEFAVNQNGWYINFDGQKLIKCNNGTGKMNCEIFEEADQSGYYLNSDPSTSYLPLIKYNGIKWIADKSEAIGWYLNADIGATNAEFIIRCTSFNACAYQEVRSGQCSVSIAGEFIKNGEIVQWCDDNGSPRDLKEGGDIIVTSFSRNEFISEANSLVGNRNGYGYGLLKINSNSILVKSSDVDGYYYSEGKLYFCPESKKGICELEKIENGYFINYGNSESKLCISPEYNENLPVNPKNCGPEYGGRCGNDNWCCKNGYCHGENELDNLKHHFPCRPEFGACPCHSTVYECKKDEIESNSYCEEINILNTCENSSVIVGGEDIKDVELCSGISGNTITRLKGLKNKNMYALKKASLGFPGSVSADYIRVEANKYYVKFIDDIKYPINIYGRDTRNCKVIEVNEKESICEIDVTKNKYEYPSDTNKGYWEWEYEGHAYKRIFDPIKNERGEIIGKYDCEVGGLCIFKDLDELSAVDNLLKNGVLYTMYNDGKKYPANEIKEGSRYYSNEEYNKYGSEGNWILCKKDGICDSKELNSDGVITPSYDGIIEGVKLKIKEGNKEIEVKSSMKYTKYVFKPSSVNGNSKRDVSEVEEYGEVIKLTHTSYTPIDDTRNIFIYLNIDDVSGNVIGDERNYKMITNEDLTIGEGYSCSKGKCIKIKREGYYLNTAQLGNKVDPGYNELVKCSNKKGFKCGFVEDIEEGIMYENAVATGAEDAIISCNKSSGCQTGVVSEVKGLLRCKENVSKNGPYREGETGNEIYYYENGMKLTEDQYCIYNNVIYGGSEQIKGEGVYMFDVTSRKIDSSKVSETHFYASLYYCTKESNCSQTYGYIINEGNSGYSICSSEGCKYISSLKDVPTKCDVAGNGGIIKEKNKDGEIVLKFCSNDSSVSITGEKYYGININARDSYPETNILDKLVVGIKNNILFTVVTDGYILIGNNNEIITGGDVEESKSNKLYECNAKTRICNPIENELKSYGYYKNAVSESVIICNENGCDTCNGSDCGTQNKPEFVVFSTNNQVVNYKFVNKEEGFYKGITYIAVTGKYRENMLLANNYILLKEEDKTTSSELYLCYEKTGKCEEAKGIEMENGPYPGWYISGDGINKAYKCEQGTCKAETLKGSCTGSNIGELIFSASNNVYQICDTTTPTSLIENAGIIKPIDSNSNPNKFPDEKKVILINKNSVIGIGNEMEEGEKLKNECPKEFCTPVSSSTGVTSNGPEYCYGNGIIKRKEGNTCGDLIGSGDKGKVVLLKGKEEAKIVEIMDVGTRMYYCDRNKSCRITQGYYKSESDWYKCDNIQCSKVNVNEENNSDEIPVVPTQGRRTNAAGSDSKIIGDLNEEGNLILGEGFGETVGRGEAPKYYYIDENNVFPGAENSESVLIEAGENYFVVFKGEGYYLVNKNSNIEDEILNNLEGSKRKRVSGINTLYMCSSDDLTCKKVDNTGNGYYINGATAKQNEAIIVCDNKNCEINNVSEVTCNDKNVGKLITETSGNVKICTSKTEAQTFSSNEIIKYYNVTISSGNKFGGISIEETAMNDKANILIRVDGKSIVQYTDKGYILYSTRWESTEGSRRNLQAVLSYCDEKVYTGIKSTVQCHAVLDIKDGWYFSEINKDNSFIECTTSANSSSECVIKKATLAEECQTSGSIIYNDNKYKMCETLKKQVEIPLAGKYKEGSYDSYKSILNVSNKTQFPGVGKDDSNIIVEVDKYSVKMLKWEGYQVVDEEDKKIIESAIKTEGKEGIISEPGLLYKCEANEGCEKVGLPRKNWYLRKNVDKLADELIYCKKDEENVNPSGSRCVVDVKPTAGFYVSADKQKPIIQCIQTGLKLNGVLDKNKNKVLCYEREIKEGWMLNSRVTAVNVEKRTGYLINCSQENGCQEKEMTEVNNGWYMNAGYGYNIDLKKNNDTESNNYYPIIQCKSSGCSSYKANFNDKCSKGGEIIYVNKKYKLCLSSNESDSVKFEEVTGQDYQVIKVENYDDFPDADPLMGYVLVEITKNEVQQRKYSDGYEHFILKDTNMYKCEGNGCSLITGESNNDKTVWEELSSKLYTASSCSSTGCRWSYIYTEEAITFLDDNRKIFTNRDITEQTVNRIKYVYKCKLNSLCIELYNVDRGIYTEGYFYNSKHYDQIGKKTISTLYYYSRKEESTGLDPEGWKIIGNENSPETIKKCTPLGYKSICSGDDIEAGNICETSNGKFYFAYEKINSGMDKENCLLMPTDSSVNYYQIGKDVYLVDKLSAYKLNEKAPNRNNPNPTKHVSTITNNIILNEGRFEEGIWREESIFNSDNIITCKDKSCSVSPTVKCSYNYQSGKCKLTAGGSLNAGQMCVSAGNGKYLAIERITSEGRCVRFDINEEIYYYLDDKDEYGSSVVVIERKYKYYVIDKKLYVTNGVGGNEYEVKTLNEGVYVIDQANNLVEFNRGYELSLDDERYRVYICNRDGCNLKSKCDNGKYNEYIYDNSKENVIKCNPDSNTLSHIDKEGYYLNKSWNDLIKCYSNGKCKEIDSVIGMEGYYLNAGNEENVIVCKRDGEKFACVEEKLRKCEYDEVNRICIAEKDMLRNSYCYYSVIDRINGKTEKIVYVENFVKAGAKGRCLAAIDSDYFIKERKSKFLGHEERSDFIKISKDSVVSVYEPTVGNYIIDTKEGQGLIEDKALKKTRLYVCKKNVCEEELPEDKTIYVNKASSEKLIKYNNKEWEIIKHKCVVDKVNDGLCNLDDGIYIANGDLIYTVDNDDVEVQAVVVYNPDKYLESEYDYRNVKSQESIKIKYRQEGKVKLLNAKELNGNTFIRIGGTSLEGCKETNGVMECSEENYSGDYLFSENKDSLMYKNSVYNFYNKNKVDIYVEKDHEDTKPVNCEFNLTPYISTVGKEYNYANIIESNKLIEEGYYINNADINNLGTVIQYMLPEKNEKISKENVPMIKAINNKCSSKVRNVCVSVEEGKVIKRGSPCVVTEGNYKGMYMAIGEISKTSSTTNCVKYDSGISTVCNFDQERGVCTKEIDGSPISAREKCIDSGLTVYVADSGRTDGKCSEIENKDGMVSYEYIGSGSGEKANVFGNIYEKELIVLSKDEIKPFKHDVSQGKINMENREGINYGYFVYDDSGTNSKIDGKLDGKFEFYSEIQKPGEAYKCDYVIEKDANEVSSIKGYSCLPFNNAQGYYYVNTYNNYGKYSIEGTVMYGSGNKWKVETARGYYFFNKENLPAKTNNVDNYDVDDEIYSIEEIGVKSEYSGRYLNRAVVVNKNQKAVLIEYDKNSGSNVISSGLKYCTVKSDGTCSPDVRDDILGVNDACYYEGKLYVVDIVNEGEDETKQKTLCYSGSEVLKYKLIEGKLYQLDGLSIQKVEKEEEEYYMLNKDLEKFESNYPEVPEHFIICKNRSCSEVKVSINLEQTIVINHAKRYYYEGEWTKMKYYNDGNYPEISDYGVILNAVTKRYYSEEIREKYMNYVVEEDSYDKCYCLDVDEKVPNEKEKCYYMNSIGECGGDYVTINYASSGNNKILIPRELKGEKDSFRYNEELDVLEYKNEYNMDDNKIIYKFITVENKDKLYQLKRRRMEAVTKEGIYLMIDGKPFNSTEWTSLSGSKKEVCYYEKGSGCNAKQIQIYRKYRYNLNLAMPESEIGIVEYDDENDKWRTVREDGLYFFFEDGYAINLEDRRVKYIYEIRDGRVEKLEEPFDKINEGYHIFNDLVVERNSGKLEDGALILENVELTSNRRCKAIETSEMIENNEYCYNGKKGLCLVRSVISDTVSNKTNCMFGENETYYYKVNDDLYRINSKSSYEKINSIGNVGLYIIDGDNKGFNSRMEGKAKVYNCFGVICNVENELESQYYYNSANNKILMYNKEKNVWINKREKNGEFFFNKFGKPVMVGDEIVTKTVNEPLTTAKYVNMASLNKSIVVVYDNSENNGKWYAVEIPSCKVENGIVIMKEKMNVGDNCIDGDILVTIKGIKEENKEKRDGEEEVEVKEEVEVDRSYEVIVPSNDSGEKRYIYDETRNDIIEISQNEVKNYNVKEKLINGKFILNKETGSFIEGAEKVEGIVYDCDMEKCTVLSNEKLKEGKRYVNYEWTESNSRVLRYVGNGEWIVENEEGYYFFDGSGNAVGKDSPTLYAIEIYNEDGKVTQRDLMDDNIIGYFLNKASNNGYIVTNNGNYYSKGKEIKNCDVKAKKDGGIVCKTTSEDVIYRKGEYCFKSNVIYLLLSDTTYTSENANCITGTNEKPLYVDSSAFGKTLNSVDVTDRLIELTSDAIRVADAGHYIVGEGNVLVDNNDNDKEISIYKCTNSKCEVISKLDENEYIIANNGTIFGMDEDQKLIKVNKDGMYFFDSNGSICGEESCVPTNIIEVKDGISNVLENDEIEVGAYINEGSPEVFGVYSGGNWEMQSITCEYTESSGTCRNDDIELNIGSYCVSEGKIYLINKVDEESNVRNCIVGNNETPLFTNNEKKELLMVKEKSLNIVKGDGYYVYNNDTLEALDSESLVKSNLVYCYEEKCDNVDVEVGNYLNRAPVDLNVAKFDDVEKSTAKTAKKACNVNGNTCSAENGQLEVGDVCINDQTLYLVNSSNECFKVEERDITYKLVGGKLYMLNDDAIIQKFDGYYFIDSESRSISSKQDYGNAGVEAYMCSNKGDCFLLEPVSGRYYPDYTTKRGNKYNVVKYDSSNKSKRDGGSGYESISEEGIIRLDDGTYTSCEYDNDDEITCKEIEEVGSYKTNDGELIVCEKDDEGEIGCRRASRGGYYIIDGKLNRCEAESEDAEELECKDVEKEGYFMANPEGDLYKCDVKGEENETEDVGVSNIFNKLFGEGERIIEEEEEEEEIDSHLRFRGEQNGDSDKEEETTSETTSMSTTETETETPTSNEEETETPEEIECVKVECDENEPISINTEEGEVQMYVCKKVEKEGEEAPEDEEDGYKWVPSEEQCESGNNVKEGEYYKCEDIDGVDENKIPQPNAEHTSTENVSSTTSSSTKSSSTTSSSTTKTTTTTGTTATTTAAPVETTTTSTVTTTTTTKGGAATTTTKPNEDGSGALSMIRNIPSLTFYLSLLIFILLFLN